MRRTQLVERVEGSADLLQEIELSPLDVEPVELGFDGVKVLEKTVEAYARSAQLGSPLFIVVCLVRFYHGVVSVAVLELCQLCVGCLLQHRERNSGVASMGASRHHSFDHAEGHSAIRENGHFLTLRNCLGIEANHLVAEGGESLPLEEVSFNYGKIEWIFTETDHRSGGVKGDVMANWDLVTNKGS